MEIGSVTVFLIHFPCPSHSTLRIQNCLYTILYNVEITRKQNIIIVSSSTVHHPGVPYIKSCLLGLFLFSELSTATNYS